MSYSNYIKLEFPNKSANEGFARVAVAAFVSQKDPTIEEMADIKTAVSEAVTNAIIHGYEKKSGIVTLCCYLNENEITITVEDNGKGISNIEQARQPMYTSKPEMERSGMGFTVMESFMDSVLVESKVDVGTKITMTKKIGKE